MQRGYDRAATTPTTDVDSDSARIHRLQRGDLRRAAVAGGPPGEPPPDPRHDVLAVVRGRAADARTGRGGGDLLDSPLRRHLHAEGLQHVARDPGMTERVQV